MTVKEIKNFFYNRIIDLWNEKKDNILDTFYKIGKIYEYMLTRVFKLEGCKVTYPYSKYFPSITGK